MKYSVIIPVFNRPLELSRAIKSVLNQTNSDLELLVIDDCSTDHTVDIAAEFARSDNRVKILRNQTNYGACISRNNGIHAATSKFIAFLDSDDEWRLNYLTEMNNLIESHPGFGAYYCDIGLVTPDHKIIPTSTPYGIEGDISSVIFKKMYLCTPTTLIVLREIATAIGGFDPDFTKGCNDDEFCIKVALNTKVKYLNKILAIFHTDAAQRISTNPIGQIEGFGRLLSKFKKQIIKAQGYECLLNHYADLETRYLSYINAMKNKL